MYLALEASFGLNAVMRSSDEGVRRIGEAVRELRRSQSLTLVQLAGCAGISDAHLSRIESGTRSPSISVLATIARCLGVRLATLLPADDDADDVVRGDPALIRAADLTVQPLSNRSNPRLNPMRVRVPGGRHWRPRSVHEGEEWIFVISGSLRVVHGDLVHEVRAGDAVHFDSTEPHRLEANTEADILVVTTAGALRG